MYDQQYGVPLAKRFHHNKPLTILDIPAEMQTEALGIADPETPVGARGVGEPPVGAGLRGGDERDCRRGRRRRVPPRAGHADLILTSLEHGKRMHDPLVAHI